MSYTAYVYLREVNENIEIPDLQVIKEMSTISDKVDEYKDFENFFLFPSKLICFVGSKTTLSTISDDIKLVKFNKSE